MNTDRVMATLYAAIDQVNMTLEEEARLPKTPDLELFGSDANVDSLAFANLILALEHKLETAFGVQVPLAQKIMLADDAVPPTTLAELADRIVELLDAGGDPS